MGSSCGGERTAGGRLHLRLAVTLPWLFLRRRRRFSFVGALARTPVAVARTVNGDADIILLDEPLAAMGAKEGAQILDLVARLKDEGRVSIIMILHNYVHVLQACDRVSMIQDGVIALDKPTAETSVEELTDIVVNEYRRAREAAHAEADAEAHAGGAPAA